MSSISNNAPCPCGSGKKYKKCCMINAATVKNSAKQSVKKHTSNFNATNAALPSEILMKAVALHQAGNLDEAELAYKALLANKPDDCDALHYLGLISFQKHRYSDAISLIGTAIRINSRVPAFHCNLGNAYRALGQLDSAIAAFLEAVKLDPQFHIAYSNLGNALKDQGRLDEAITSYRNALALRPDFAEAHNNLGVALGAQGKFDEAVESFRRAISLNPYYANAYCSLGGVLKNLGKFDEALDYFQQHLKLEPDNDATKHIIAALKGSNMETAPAAYVEKLFDEYADRFDTHIQQVLKCDIPKKLVSLIMQHSTPPVEKWDVLDLGCGTGLIGPEIASVARQLVGVDLSAKMLEKAKLRNLYQRLEHLDLMTMMQRENTASYDVIIAADVFVYIGKLDEIFSEVKRLLRPGGIFEFSVETPDPSSDKEGTQQEYKLHNTGRYIHSVGYIKRLAADNGFLIQESEETPLRMELGKPVNGLIALLKN